MEEKEDIPNKPLPTKIPSQRHDFWDTQPITKVGKDEDLVIQIFSLFLFRKKDILQMLEHLKSKKNLFCCQLTLNGVP